ncbi:MAG: hypothetical protein NTW29_19950 [Bacteroidetes bacterium]|nr:hypothetical protein [Bacteroidota bacterium]
MKKLIICLLGLTLIGGIACQKELSFELGDTPAKGSLQSDVSGDCLPKSVNGLFVENIALVSTSNTITVSVNVTQTGTYTIGTDTVNGYYFRGVGTFTALGANTVTLRGFGTPFAQGVNNFVVSFDGTVCDIQVTVLPPGSGPAVFTLAGAPAACTTPVINGTYVTGGALNAANTVVLNVNVTTAGTYNVSTTATNGMTFAGTGSLLTGAQTITLTGTGTPTAAGNTTIPVTVGASTCSFTISVLAPIAGTLGGGPGACTPVTINGTYTQGVALTAANTIQVQITTAAVGPYSVSTNSVAGISFSGTGTSNGATQTITLNGTGTPTASGPQNFTVSFGTSTCSFSLTIQGPAVYTIDCPNVIVNGTYQVGSALGAPHTIDIPITVTTAGTYNITGTINGMTFSGTGTLTLASTNITLQGSGTPGTAGTSNLSIGTPACIIPITVGAAPTIDWSFQIGATTYQGSTVPGGVTFDNTTFPPFTALDYLGDNVAAEDFNVGLIDIIGGINANETYTSNTALPVNIGTFYFTNATLDLTADPTTPTVTMSFRVTSHNTVTRTIIGTFSGTAVDAISSTNKTIANGTFTAVY